MSSASTKSDAAYQWEIVDRICVLRARAGEFEESDFQRWLHEVQDSNVQAILAVAKGVATVNATQRKATAEMIKKKNIRTYVVTDSALTRGIVTAVSWLGAQISSHSWKNLDEVLSQLDRPPEVTSRIKRLVESFRS